MSLQPYIETRIFEKTHPPIFAIICGMKCDIADVDELCDEMMRANIYYQLRRHEPGAFEKLERFREEVVCPQMNDVQCRRIDERYALRDRLETDGLPERVRVRLMRRLKKVNNAFERVKNEIEQLEKLYWCDKNRRDGLAEGYSKGHEQGRKDGIIEVYNRDARNRQKVVAKDSAGRFKGTKWSSGTGGEMIEDFLDSVKKDKTGREKKELAWDTWDRDRFSAFVSQEVKAARTSYPGKTPEELKRILFEKRFYPACFRALKGSAI